MKTGTLSIARGKVKAYFPIYETTEEAVTACGPDLLRVINNQAKARARDRAEATHRFKPGLTTIGSPEELNKFRFCRRVPRETIPKAHKAIQTARKSGDKEQLKQALFALEQQIKSELAQLG